MTDRRAALSGAHEGLLEAGARRVEGTAGKLDGLVEPAGEPQNEMLTAAIASPSRGVRLLPDPQPVQFGLEGGPVDGRGQARCAGGARRRAANVC